jgi:hypothetical protein
MFKRIVYAVFSNQPAVFVICFGTFGFLMWEAAGLAKAMYAAMGPLMLIPWFLAIYVLLLRPLRRRGY